MSMRKKTFFSPFVWLLILAPLFPASIPAAEITLLTPPDGATFDPVSPIEREFRKGISTRFGRF
ncbi:MAG: hypothetical protein Q4D98_10865 [Planctomycetia bacterium]|nr:hypothetical protein [Planctomycetia bacterium]